MRELQGDVAVVGGGPAGIAAAVAARRQGARVVLIERHPCFGGNATSASVASFCGFYTRGAQPDVAVAGIGGEVIERLAKVGDSTEVSSSSSGNTTVKFNPEDLKAVLDDVMADEGVGALLHATFAGCACAGGEISSIDCVDDEGRFTVRAAQYVDATGNAALAASAGVPTQWGDAQGVVQQASLVFRLDGLPARVIDPSELREAIIAGKKAGIVGLSKEGGVIIKFDDATYGFCTIPSTPLADLSARTLTAVERNLRHQARTYAEAFRRFIPDMAGATVSHTGPTVGLRESRRVCGEACITGDAILAGEKRDDSVARAAWSPEIHSTSLEPRFEHIPDNDYASIPWGALKAERVRNLWVAGRCISCDPLALASVRVMGTSFATGHAAGVSAALAVAGTPDVQDVRRVLREQHALL